MSDTKSGPSGRFLLRIEPGLHAALRRAAEAAGLSLNEYCARKLAVPSGSTALSEGAGRALAHAAEVLGDDLRAAVVYGSWARGEAGEESDVDLLLVVDDRRAITRDLYRDWDRAPVSWDGLEVEPHFVHLPPTNRPASGLWGEVALDGVVLFERGGRLSAALARVRRDLAEGRLVRKQVQGQPYWVHAA